MRLRRTWYFFFKKKGRCITVEGQERRGRARPPARLALVPPRRPRPSRLLLAARGAVGDGRGGTSRTATGAGPT